MNYFEIINKDKGFEILKTKRQRSKLNYHSELDIIKKYKENNYLILKASSKFKIISDEELIKFEYCFYYFYLTDKCIQNQLDILNNLQIITLHHIPDIKYLKKIKIK